MAGHVRPFRRNVRQFEDGTYRGNGAIRYIEHQRYAQDPEKYVRAFQIIQKDLIELFDYIEPSDGNSACYSFRIHALLMRACIEIEANCKAIMLENGYGLRPNMGIRDYKKINSTHRLDKYRIRLPYWNGTDNIRVPFAAWSSGGSLAWYNAYNASKHDRHSNFAMATMGCLVDAMCGLVALLSSQFHREDYGPGYDVLAIGGPTDGFDTAIGNYFEVAFPTDWPPDQRYAFSSDEWQSMKALPDPFHNLSW